MEPVQLNSSDSYATESGLFAVIPSRIAMVDELNRVNIFEFRTSSFGPAIRVEWPVDSDVALLPADVASAMLVHGWARNLTDGEADAYNAAVAAFILETSGKAPGEPEPEPTEAPRPEAVAADGTTDTVMPDAVPVNPFVDMSKRGKR